MYYQSYFVAKKKNIKHLKMLKKNPHQYIIFTKANAEEKKIIKPIFYVKLMYNVEDNFKK